MGYLLKLFIALVIILAVEAAAITFSPPWANFNCPKSMVYVTPNGCIDIHSLPPSLQRCATSPGHWVDQMTCLDKDECSAGAHNCASPSSTCVNIYGSFYCNCNQGYIRDGDVCVPSPENIFLNNLCIPAERIQEKSTDSRWQIDSNRKFIFPIFSRNNFFPPSRIRDTRTGLWPTITKFSNPMAVRSTIKISHTVINDKISTSNIRTASITVKTTTTAVISRSSIITSETFRWSQNQIDSFSSFSKTTSVFSPTKVSWQPLFTTLPARDFPTVDSMQIIEKKEISSVKSVWSSQIFPGPKIATEASLPPAVDLTNILLDSDATLTNELNKTTKNVALSTFTPNKTNEVFQVAVPTINVQPILTTRANAHFLPQFTQKVSHINQAKQNIITIQLPTSTLSRSMPATKTLFKSLSPSFQPINVLSPGHTSTSVKPIDFKSWLSLQQPTGDQIIGMVYKDKDRNNIADEGEGLSGVSVNLLGKYRRNIIATSWSDQTGLYGFVGIPNGSYIVAVDRITTILYPYTDPDIHINAETHFNLIPTNHKRIINVDFGFYENTLISNFGQLQGTTFYDRDGNGVLDEGEGTGGALIGLFDVDSTNKRAEIISAKNGSYVMAQIPLGKYRLKIIQAPLGLTAQKSDLDALGVGEIFVRVYPGFILHSLDFAFTRLRF